MKIAVVGTGHVGLEMKNMLSISFCLMTAVLCAKPIQNDTSLHFLQQKQVLFWLRQPISILPMASTGYGGEIECTLDGFLFKFDRRIQTLPRSIDN